MASYVPRFARVSTGQNTTGYNYRRETRRQDPYLYPREDQHLIDLCGMHSAMNKLFVVNAEMAPRITIVLIDQPVGF
jgi:hypothetical protein